MGLYTGNLNEFIDWISRRDTLTNRQFTTETISGGSIRNLLQTHLRKPFYVHEDIDNNKKLLFSSEESKIRYYKAVEEAGGNEQAIAKKYIESKYSYQTLYNYELNSYLKAFL